jgi:ABC-type branched-subunit amino acid transport system substrate-binding protein
LNPIASYEGAYLLADALKKAGSVDPLKLRRALTSQKNFKLPTGSTVFRWTKGYTHRTASIIGFNAAGVPVLSDTITP